MNKNAKSEFEELMKFIQSKYSKKEIDWYQSLLPENQKKTVVKVKVSNNSYADKK